ncbi:DUF4397 domain-containing protein [Haloarchaeobius sp. DFWS5]|uniref:DUF4397 domain-containing protein n=1 Tax=Haloarchaeobius sp. DFWS5 TaxID=3446114 RepID=UPI003EBE79E7
MSARTYLRIGHCAPDDSPVDVFVDGRVVAEAVEFGTISDYLELETGHHDVNLMPVGGQDETLLRTVIDFDAGSEYTVLALGAAEDPDSLVLQDRNEVHSRAGRLRVVNVCLDVPAVDVGFDGAMKFSNLPAGTASEYANFGADDYTMQVVPTDAGELLFEVPDVRIEDGMTYTAFIVGEVATGSFDVVVTHDHRPTAKMA